jgi:membrane fusion protein, multidrug efflux system
LERILASLHNLPLRRRWTLGVVLVAIALGGYLGWLYVHGSKIGTAASGETNGSEMLPPIPVTVAQVKTADFPVYLNGLGTVEPYHTVTVRSRVDGEITKVAFKQGQMIKEGDLLVQIDPRPYHADSIARQQLDTQQAMVDQLIEQAKGDQAAIDNAQTQLGYTTIQSPLTGKVGFRLVDPGNIVHESGHSADDQNLCPERPHADNPRFRPRRAVHTAAYHRAGSDGDLCLSAKPMGNGHPERQCRSRCSAPAH